MSKKKPPIYMCHGCRRTKLIVKNAQGMSFCEECKHKAPTKFQFNEFVHENSANLSPGRFEPKSRPARTPKGLIEVTDTELYD